MPRLSRRMFDHSIHEDSLRGVAGECRKPRDGCEPKTTRCSIDDRDDGGAQIQGAMGGKASDDRNLPQRGNIGGGKTGVPPLYGLCHLYCLEEH